MILSDCSSASLLLGESPRVVHIVVQCHDGVLEALLDHVYHPVLELWYVTIPDIRGQDKHAGLNWDHVFQVAIHAYALVYSHGAVERQVNLPLL